MTVKFSNSGKALITSTVYTHSQTVDVDDASVFPSIVDYGNDYFYVTFQNPSTGASEICKVTDVMGNKLFIERAQDGTTAGSFGAGDKCENRLNAGALIEAVNDFDITSQTDPKYLRSNTDDTTTHVITSHSNAKWPLVIGKFVGGSHNQKIKLQGSASPNIDFCSEQHERMMFGYSSLGYGQWYVHDGDNNSARLKLDEDGTLKLTATVSADGVTSETYSDATVFHSGLFTNNATDWDTAYSWGDHADAGYLTAETHADAGYLTAETHADAGYLTSHQDISGKLDKSGGTLTGATTIEADSNALTLYSDTNGAGVGVNFSDQTARQQKGYFRYYHSDTVSYGSGSAFVASGSEPTMTFLADGKLMYKDGIYSKPADGTGAGTRKDANWDTAYGWGNHASAGYLTSHQDISGKLDKSGGTMTGQLTIEGTSPQMKFADTGDHDDFWVHVNSNRFYVLSDRDENGSWETPYALELDAGVNKSYTFGNEIWHAGNFTDNSSNWDTAYGWGNHASAGYLTAAPSKASPATSRELGNVDLDDYAQPADAGFYHQLGNSDADVEDNWPNGRAGSLLVQKSANSGNFGTTQLFIDYSQSDVYVRSMYGDSSADKGWKRLYTTSDFTNNASNWNTAHGWGNHASAGYLTSHQNISGKLDKSGGTVTGGLTINTSNPNLIIQNNSGNGAGIKFKDMADDTQYGNIEYFHQDAKSYGSGEAFVVRGDETEMSFVVKGKVMYEDGVWLAGSANNNTAAVRKDANWDTAYGWGNHASAGYLTNHNAAVLTSGGLSDDLDTNLRAGMHGWRDSTDNRPSGSSYGQLLSIVSSGNTHNDDNNWITQLAFGTGLNAAYFRGKTNDGNWGAWKTFLHSGNFTDNSSNWDTAHGWGNHASAGYLTSETHASAGYLTSHQSISGKANLSGANFTGNVSRSGTGSNNTPNQDQTVLSGYGLIGNRNAPLYVTNSNASGTVQIGIGGAHNANAKLTLSSSAATFTVPISTSGAITASGNVTAYSDERLKDNIETLDGSKVYEMRGVSFTKDGEANSGVIAQELQKVAPELVSDDGEYLSVAYGNTIGYLIEAIKDLKEEVDDLKAKLEDKD